eukprot:TRINITY_DN38098_c0_g1_i1.p1 TRINITY_DN38098_c0_g1~~TRINITY_DN38098_c0_g1_i1.p1  ORF type:complete len:528 (+),score=147.55 TRINITY_DN38098_c0_g1_i1:304-1887(+)
MTTNADFIFNQLDADGNGYITREEFERFRASGGLAAAAAAAPAAAPAPERRQQPPQTSMPRRLPGAGFGAVPNTGLAAMGQAPGAGAGGGVGPGVGNAPPSAGPMPASMQQNGAAMPPPAPMVMAWPLKGWASKNAAEAILADDELSEEARSLRDARRAFALGGSSLIVLLALLPAWSSLALLRSPTYLYFSGAGSAFGGLLILLDIIVIIWITMIDGIGFPSCPLPNPFRHCGGMLRMLRAVPSETYVMIALTIFLMMIWKVLPMMYIGGIRMVFNWFFGLFGVFGQMWFSSDPAATILSCCFSAVLLYMFSLSYFFARGKTAARGRVSSMFAIWTAFVTFMGIGFVFFSMPVSKEASLAYDELLTSCETGARTRDLFITSQALQSLRQTRGCAELPSVEKCVGFQATMYSDVLKNMEAELRCSGFCYDPKSVRPLVGGTAPTIPEYPPTLFTKANYQASCEGMAARNMQNFVGAVGTQIFQQGMLLLTVALGLSMLYVIGICNGEAEGDARPATHVPGTGYGAVM